jgi:flagellar biosynthesis protein
VVDKPTPAPPETTESDGGRQVAVALHQGVASAPRVVAKGHGKLAEQILNIAFERGVKVRTDADLAEILAAVEVDSEVPLPALAAVAEILSYVYGMSAPPAAQSTP